MADKDSWWKDNSKNSGEDSLKNPFGPRTTQNDGTPFEARSVNEGSTGFDLRRETFERKEISRKKS